MLRLGKIRHLVIDSNRLSFNKKSRYPYYNYVPELILSLPMNLNFLAKVRTFHAISILNYIPTYSYIIIEESARTITINNCGLQKSLTVSFLPPRSCSNVQAPTVEYYNTMIPMRNRYWGSLLALKVK